MQNGQTSGLAVTGISPKSQYSTSREPGAAALTFATCAFVMFSGEVMNTPPLSAMAMFRSSVGREARSDQENIAVLQWRAGTHSSPCGPTPPFWQIVGHCDESTWFANN